MDQGTMDNSDGTLDPAYYSDGTAIPYMYTPATADMVEADFDIDAYEDHDEYLYRERLKSKAFLGAVIGSNRPSNRPPQLIVKYWPDGRPKGVIKPQRNGFRPLQFFAGFTSHHRGRHWDRKRH